MKRKSTTPWLPFSSPLLLRPLPDISLATYVGLGSPFTPSLYKRHYMLPMKIYKRNRRKSYVQFAESMGSTALTINLYSIYNSNDQGRFLNTMECDHRGKGQGNFAVFHISAVPNSIDRIKFDISSISTTVARLGFKRRATAVPNSIHKL